jgi:hypothetical protein
MRVVDRSLLHLIRLWLRDPVWEAAEGNEEKQKIQRPQKGTPQGGVISPLPHGGFEGEAFCRQLGLLSLRELSPQWQPAHASGDSFRRAGCGQSALPDNGRLPIQYR